MWWSVQPDPAVTGRAQAEWSKAETAMASGDVTGAVASLAILAEYGKQPKVSPEAAALAWAARGRRDELVAFSVAWRDTVADAPAPLGVPAAEGEGDTTGGTAATGEAALPKTLEEVIAEISKLEAARRETDFERVSGGKAGYVQSLLATRRQGEADAKLGGGNDANGALATATEWLQHFATTSRSLPVPPGYNVPSAPVPEGLTLREMLPVAVRVTGDLAVVRVQHNHDTRPGTRWWLTLARVNNNWYVVGVRVR
jgi:hypothetical protein